MAVSRSTLGSVIGVSGESGPTAGPEPLSRLTTVPRTPSVPYRAASGGPSDRVAPPRNPSRAALSDGYDAALRRDPTRKRAAPESPCGPSRDRRRAIGPSRSASPGSHTVTGGQPGGERDHRDHAVS